MQLSVAFRDSLPPDLCVLILTATAFAMFATVEYLPTCQKQKVENKLRDSRTFRTKKWEAEVESANGTGIDLIAKSTMVILY